MNTITKLCLGLASGGILIAGCGTSPAATNSSPTAPTEATTTTVYAAPTTTTTIDVKRVAMAAWAGAHSRDMAAVTTALNKASAIAAEIATTAGNNVDNYTATHNSAQLMAGADKVLALQESQKQACLGIATAAKAAQKGLPVPIDSVNESYSSALDHYLSAARACQVGQVAEAISEISAGNEDVQTTTQALKDLIG